MHGRLPGALARTLGILALIAGVATAAACGSASPAGTAPDVVATDTGATDLPGDPDATPDTGAPDAGLPDLPSTDTGTDLPPAPTPIPPDFLGMCPLDGDPSTAHWDLMASWGVRLVRQGFFWNSLERVQGTWDFTWSDRYMDEAGKRGMGVLITLDYDADWIHADGATQKGNITPDHFDEWLTYVRTVAARYKDTAWGFEVWNEPNHPWFWKGTMEDFVALARVTVDAVHEVAPGKPVAVSAFSLLPMDWMDAMHAAGVITAADALSFHPYWIDAEGAIAMVETAQEWLAQKGLDKPVWLTEYGWPSGGNYPTATDLDGQAERLIRLQAGLAALGGVRASWWYASRDSSDPDQVTEPDNSEGFFGMSYPTAGDKPVARAYAVLGKRLPGTVADPAAGAAFAAGGALTTRGFRASDGSVVVVATNLAAAPVDLALSAGATVDWPVAPNAALAIPGQVTVAAGRSVILSGPASIAGE